MTGLSQALKGLGGEFEVNRLVGAFGVAAYTIGANIFVAVDVIVNGREFDVTAYCLAFPGGLGVALGALAGAVAIKDRNVATARVIQDTGSAPGLAAPSPIPHPVIVTNDEDNAIPVDQKP